MMTPTQLGYCDLASGLSLLGGLIVIPFAESGLIPNWASIVAAVGIAGGVLGPCVARFYKARQEAAQANAQPFFEHQGSPPRGSLNFDRYADHS
jgi:hypothetical protein